MTMHQKRMKRLLDQYLSEELSDDRQAKVCRHLERCERCRQEIASRKSIERLLADATPEPACLSREAAGALFERAYVASGVGSRRPGWSSANGLAVSVALTSFAAFAIGWSSLHVRSVASPGALPAPDLAINPWPSGSIMKAAVQPCITPNPKRMGVAPPPSLYRGSMPDDDDAKLTEAVWRAPMPSETGFHTFVLTTVEPKSLARPTASPQGRLQVCVTINDADTPSDDVSEAAIPTIFDSDMTVADKPVHLVLPITLHADARPEETALRNNSSMFHPEPSIIQLTRSCLASLQ